MTAWGKAMTELGDTRARVDHDLCAGVAECLRQAPGAFLLDDDGMSVFAPSAPWTPGQLAVARDSCPTQAITILPDGAGPAGDTASGAAGER